MYATADWEVAACDLNGRSRKYIQEWSFTVIRRIMNYSEIDMQVIPGATGSDELLIGQRVIKAWRNTVPRFVGRVVDPLIKSSSTIQVKCFDAAHNLSGRRMQLDGNGNPPSYTTYDSSAMIMDRFNVQNARSPIHVTAGTLASTTPMSINFNADTVEFQAVQQIAGADGGPWWRIDPLDNTTGAWGQLMTWAGPGTGADQKKARFEYGEGTLGNLSDYSKQETLPKNQVIARGAGSTDIAPVSVKTDAASQALYDMWEDVVTGAANATTQDQVDKLAISSLLPTPPQTWTLTPNPDASIPMLWDDYDAGDTVYWYVNDFGINELHSGIVMEAKVKIDSSGVEDLQALTLQQIT